MFEFSNYGCSTTAKGSAEITEAPIRMEEAKLVLTDIKGGGYKMKECIIQTQDLVHTYPTGVTALKGVNLSIYRNDKISIIGQNGR